MLNTLTKPQPAWTHPTAAKDCGACNGLGGRYVYADGKTPGKSLQRWVVCTPCKGTGKV